MLIACESNDVLTRVDLDSRAVATAATGSMLVGDDTPGENAHSVAVDPATHHVFFR